ncbi:hypothetical protein ACHHYP_12556 [Achlya hypogyna]|uniref:Transmembrane protein n=1 Tax=Achlya hypogyna TaxID=1202772 RepID=A0A1V9YGW9_ACHHY|nr:hypothetical protein ACHHYP_12556 [Achlya hypogyna]
MGRGIHALASILPSPADASPVVAFTEVTVPLGRHRVEAVLGLGYLLVSLTCGFWYLSLLYPSFANDLWWAGFNLSGHEAFLVDLSNALLAKTQITALDIAAPSAVVAKSYASPISFTNVQPTYARRVILAELTTITYAVPYLRQLSASWSMRMNTQWCWVDFNRSFEIAHTLARQERCLNNFRSNAAVYMEATLRNQVWDDYIAVWGGDNAPFTVAIQQPLEETITGRALLASLAQARNSTSVMDEISYWRSFNMDHFQLQWQNRWQSGITESIVLENALGMQQIVTLKSLSQVTGPWTSMNFFWISLNDIWNGQELNRSIVRGTTTFLGSNVSVSMPAIDLESYNGCENGNGTYLNQTAVVRDVLGPFFSIDCFYVAPPTALAQAVTAVQQALFEELSRSPALFAAFATMDVPIVAPVPPSWTSMSYYGGNPMCLTNPLTSFVQQSFDFFDACSSPEELTLQLAPGPVLFAMVAAPQLSVPDICNVVSPSLVCSEALAAASSMLSHLVLQGNVVIDVANTTAVVERLNIGLMQFATTPAGVWTLLRQPLLDTSAFTFFGWLFLHDWASGAREVVSFQGDNGSLTLISNVYPPQYYATGTQPPENATRIVFYLVIATSVVLVAVGGLSVIYGLYARLHFRGRNLLFFNRVVGGVWIGRPLACLRGITAILVLSTANVTLVSTHGFSRLDAAPRSVFETLIITGEATWLAYVLNEVLLVVPLGVASHYSPFSSCLSWFVLFCIEISSPVHMKGTLARHCTGVDMDFGLVCSSGNFATGSLARVVMLAAIQLGIVVFSVIATALVSGQTNCNSKVTLLVSGVAQAFVATFPGSTICSLDYVACVLCGLLPLWHDNQPYTFDLKLWLLLKDKLSTTSYLKALPRPTLGYNGSRSQPGPGLPIADCTGTNKREAPAYPSKTVLHSKAAWDLLWRVLGLSYGVCAIVDSVSYLNISQANFANDLFWASFNTSGTHAFVANWLNEQLILGNRSMPDLALDRPSISRMASYAGTSAIVTASVNFGTDLQHAPLSTLAGIIEGLRRSDACSAPWIFTPYCFVDFDQNFELANSAKRQLRCQSMTTNGAIFLESVLRNIDHTAFYSCWGVAFEAAIATELRLSISGKSWLATMFAPTPVTVADEVACWTDHGITSFETQWQNYKRIGAINSYSIVNAFGVVYPLTLQAQNGSYRFDSQTSFKMYWAFANDLDVIMDNTTSIAGQSLIRTSANYAFANTTLAAVMIQNGTLASPLSEGFYLLSSVVGPFGSIDMVYVPVPPALRTVTSTLVELSRLPLAGNLVAQAAYFNITPLDSSYPIPATWISKNFYTYGGSPLCPELLTIWEVDQGLFTSAAFGLICYSATGVISVIHPTRQHYIVSAILAGLHLNTSAQDWSDICANDPTFVSACVDYLDATMSFVHQYMAMDADLQASIMAAVTLVRGYNIEFMSYTRMDLALPLILERVGLLDPAEKTFSFFAWVFLYDWILGNREVISFQGDVGTMTLLSDLDDPLLQKTQPWQVTANIAQYLRGVVVYVTYVMMAVAAMTILYIIASKGHFEGRNLFKLGSVGGIVWVGRPLLFLRSMTALGLLSTAPLELQFSGFMSSLSTVPVPWYKTVLAANEVTWLASTVNDILLVITREYSAYYILPNQVLLVGVVAALSFLQPITATTNIALHCDITEVDFQAVCTAGSIQIGHLGRLLTLVGVVFTCKIVGYYITRLLVGRTPESAATSLLLSSGARFLYCHNDRTHLDVYYLDRASAALDGLLTWRLGLRIVVLDVKLWRTFSVAIPATGGIIFDDTDLRAAFKEAYPLHD